MYVTFSTNFDPTASKQANCTVRTHTHTLADQLSRRMLFVLELLDLFISFNSDIIFLANCKATACLRVRYFGRP